MERERLGNGCYRVFLSDEELQDWGLSFERLSMRSPCTRALLSALLTDAFEGELLPADGIIAEVFPVEGGCCLLFSRESKRENATYNSSPLCVVFSDVDALFSFCKAAAGTCPAGGSLYVYDGCPCLVLIPTPARMAQTTALLSQWECSVQYGEAAAAFLAEHGSLVFAGDALERLNELG